MQTEMHSRYVFQVKQLLVGICLEKEIQSVNCGLGERGCHQPLDKKITGFLWPLGIFSCFGFSTKDGLLQCLELFG